MSESTVRPLRTHRRSRNLSGHHVAEENPDDLVAALLTHFTPLQQACH
jgi:hypothetical protein